MNLKTCITINTKTQSNVFQMAWASKEEEAMDMIGKHMQSMRLEKKRELNKLYSKLIFPRQGQNWTDVKMSSGLPIGELPL